MPNRIVHFEVEAKDKMRAKKFYEEAFGWKMDVMSEDMGGYISVDTGNEPMGINGGIYQDSEKHLNAFSCVVGVDDVDKAIEDVKAAGGKVFPQTTDDGRDVGEKADIPGIGIYVKCEDTEGNKFTLLEPSPDMKTQK
jgi:predicted enzyme related to lactoylglutathione lyase